MFLFRQTVRKPPAGVEVRLATDGWVVSKADLQGRITCRNAAKAINRAARMSTAPPGPAVGLKRAVAFPTARAGMPLRATMDCAGAELTNCHGIAKFVLVKHRAVADNRSLYEPSSQALDRRQQPHYRPNGNGRGDD
jgi:hypothetical protein